MDRKAADTDAAVQKVSNKIMIQQLPGFILIVVVAMFIFMVNSINLKKNRAIHLRAVVLHLKNRLQSEESEVTEEELEKAVSEYNSAAEEFNLSITSGAGAVLNKMLRYPLFELQDSER